MAGTSDKSHTHALFTQVEYEYSRREYDNHVVHYHPHNT